MSELLLNAVGALCRRFPVVVLRAGSSPTTPSGESLADWSIEEGQLRSALNRLGVGRPPTAATAGFEGHPYRVAVWDAPTVERLTVRIATGAGAAADYGAS